MRPELGSINPVTGGEVVTQHVNPLREHATLGERTELGTRVYAPLFGSRKELFVAIADGRTQPQVRVRRNNTDMSPVIELYVGETYEIFEDGQLVEERTHGLDGTTHTMEPFQRHHDYWMGVKQRGALSPGDDWHYNLARKREEIGLVKPLS